MYSLLIVDDEYQTRSGLRDLIDWGALGIRVIGDAEDGEEALPMLEALAPDILLTDVRMNRMDGIALATEARRRFPEITIVFISGYSDSDYLRHALRVEALDYLYKPIHVNELKALMRRIVENLDARAQIRTRREKARLLLEKSKPLLIERFLRSWFFGMLEDEQAIEERLSLLELRFPIGGIAAAALQPNWPSLPSAGQAEEYQITLEKAVRKWLPGALTCAEDGGVIVLLPAESGESLTHIAQALADVAAHMRNASGIELSIGLSRRYANCTEAPRAVSEALEAATGQMDSGAEIVRYTPESAPSAAPCAQPLGLSVEHALMTGDFDALWANISETLSGLGHSAQDAETARKRMMDYALRTELFLESQSLPGIDAMDFCCRSAGRMPLSAVQSTLKASLARACECIRAAREKAYSAAVSQALSIIQQRYRERLSIEDIADAVHYSPAHLSTLFRQETGGTIGDALLRTRLAAATALLRTTNDSVSAIAQATGYGDVQYFSRVFKRLTGMTPLEYRRKALPC